MTSEAIHNQKTGETPVNAAAQNQWTGGAKSRHSLELTRAPGFVNGTQDIFDVLAQRDLQLDSPQRSMGATLALLRRAQDSIDKAEERLDVQNNRIKRLENALMIDELTGLYNRHGLIKALDREIARVQRQKSSGGLLLFMEVDNLLAVGQRHGREAVKSCLKLIGAALQSEVRAMDIAARNGQDQFILVFPDTQRDNAMQRVQKLALRMNNLSLIWNMQEVPIHVSLQVKSYTAGEQAEHLIQDRTATSTLRATKTATKTEAKNPS